MKNIWSELSRKYNLDIQISGSGYSNNSNFNFAGYSENKASATPIIENGMLIPPLGRFLSKYGKVGFSKSNLFSNT